MVGVGIGSRMVLKSLYDTVTEKRDMLLDLKQIVSRLETEGIFLGKNPHRTLIYWRQVGLIPPRCCQANMSP
jgi:hypothetical protein